MAVTSRGRRGASHLIERQEAVVGAAQHSGHDEVRPLQLQAEGRLGVQLLPHQGVRRPATSRQPITHPSVTRCRARACLPPPLPPPLPDGAGDGVAQHALAQVVDHLQAVLVEVHHLQRAHVDLHSTSQLPSLAPWPAPSLPHSPLFLLTSSKLSGSSLPCAGLLVYLTSMSAGPCPLSMPRSTCG